MAYCDASAVCGLDCRYAEKGEDISPEMFNKITHEVAAGAMKYALLSCSCHVQINFDIAKVACRPSSCTSLSSRDVTHPRVRQMQTICSGQSAPEQSSRCHRII